MTAGKGTQQLHDKQQQQQLHKQQQQQQLHNTNKGKYHINKAPRKSQIHKQTKGKPKSKQSENITENTMTTHKLKQIAYIQKQIKIYTYHSGYH